MKLFKLKPNKQSILFLAAVLAVLVVACIGLFVKQQAAVAAASCRLEAKLRQLEEGSAVASRLAATEAELQSDRDELKFLESSLPNAAYVPTLLKQVEALAVETHNDVRGVRPSVEVSPPPSLRDRRSDPEAAARAADAQDDKNKDTEEKKAPEPYDKLKIQLALTGKYADCLQLIHRLTRFPKIVSVNDVQFRPRFDDSVGGDPKIDVDLNLTAFILKDKTTVPPLPVKEEHAT
jgi:Tfp pilus assembly protein PilO